MELKALDKAIRRVLGEDWPDEQLRSKLEALAETEQNFGGFTWVWGPVLYARNRVLFRPFILGRFGQGVIVGKYRWEAVRWKGDVAEALEPWLQEVDRRDDIELFRRLYEWKLGALGTGAIKDARQKAISPDLIRRFRGAATRANRDTVLQKFALWYELDEPTALELYRIDPLSAGPFILRHLPWTWMENKRAYWQLLLAEAQRRGDEPFRWDLYRRQVPRETWEADALALASSVRDPAELIRQLEQRHPSGWDRSLGAGLQRLLEQRGRDVMPYVVRHLTSVRRGFFTGGDYGKLLELARDRAWWDLWAAVIRVCANPKDYNREIARLLADAALPPATVAERLAALCGVSRELNFGGFGVAAMHQLDEANALALLARFPELLRGPFLQHLQVNPWMGSYTRLIGELMARNEADLLDHVAARIATRRKNRYNPKAADMLVDAERLADYYGGMKAEETRFSRRASSVLSRIPAFAIHGYADLIRDNRLARLLFERSSSSYLADSRSMRDLVEGSEIHVQALAYRALGLDDPRARILAGENLSLLLGTLLRPLQRATRLLAFRALANAAATKEDATRVLAKAREAFDLPDERYPKEALLGLIGALLVRWPELRGPREEPVVYRRSAA
jgi:hypothetical protein